jgi:hypothetical protein
MKLIDMFRKEQSVPAQPISFTSITTGLFHKRTQDKQEDDMTTLIQSIATGTSEFLVNTVLATSALFAIRIQTGLQSTLNLRPERLNVQTMADIGIEPGSITWQ